jgi:hypothetical protein
VATFDTNPKVISAMYKGSEGYSKIKTWPEAEDMNRRVLR